MKRLLALLLVLCMVFALGACGKKTDSPNSTGDSKNNAANNKEEKEDDKTYYYYDAKGKNLEISFKPTEI